MCIPQGLMARRGVLLQTALQHKMSSCRGVVESISHFLSSPGFSSLGAVNASLSRAACSTSREFFSKTFAATADLESCHLSGQEAKCWPLQRKARNQDSHQMRWGSGDPTSLWDLGIPHHWGRCERQGRVSFL